MVLWLSLDCLSDALYLLDIAVHLHTGQCPSPPHTRPLAQTPRVCAGTYPHSQLHAVTRVHTDTCTCI